MKTGAYVCYVLAALGLFSAIKVIMQRINEGTEIAQLVGNMVGAMLVPIGLLVLGLVLYGKSKKDE